jgi:integrase/recombinase XerD
MIRDMPLQRLAPKPPKAYVPAVAGLAKFSGCAPDQLSPDQMRSYLHHLLVERRLAWRSCTQVACGLKFFSVTTLGWDALHLHLPPRPGRRLLPHLMSAEALQRLCTSAPNPRPRG